MCRIRGRVKQAICAVNKKRMMNLLRLIRGGGRCHSRIRVARASCPLWLSRQATSPSKHNNLHPRPAFVLFGRLCFQRPNLTRSSHPTHYVYHKVKHNIQSNPAGPAPPTSQALHENACRRAAFDLSFAALSLFIHAMQGSHSMSHTTHTCTNTHIHTARDHRAAPKLRTHQRHGRC